MAFRRSTVRSRLAPPFYLVKFRDTIYILSSTLSGGGAVEGEVPGNKTSKNPWALTGPIWFRQRDGTERTQAEVGHQAS
jgi:hypothetical protein